MSSILREHLKKFEWSKEADYSEPLPGKWTGVDATGNAKTWDVPAQSQIKFQAREKASSNLRFKAQVYLRVDGAPSNSSSWRQKTYKIEPIMERSETPSIWERISCCISYCFKSLKNLIWKPKPSTNFSLRKAYTHARAQPMYPSQKTSSLSYQSISKASKEDPEGLGKMTVSEIGKAANHYLTRYPSRDSALRRKPCKPDSFGPYSEKFLKQSEMITAQIEAEESKGTQRGGLNLQTMRQIFRKAFFLR